MLDLPIYMTTQTEEEGETRDRDKTAKDNIGEREHETVEDKFGQR